MIRENLGPYRVLEKIGTGGMGEVYRARDTRLDRDVAIKRSATEFSERFTREARSIAALNHSNICHLYDVGPDYLVLEYVEGAHPAGPMAFDEALPIIRQLIDGLEAAHEKGIIHRDLKTANIKITTEGVVKILDFGLAKAAEQESAIDPANSPTFTMGVTQAGVILGTAAYMAPEQAKGKPADRRSDIWSFGVVVYELLVGRTPFAGESPVDILGAVINKEPDWTAVPPRARRLLHWCLQKDRRARLAAIGDARVLLEEADAVSSRDGVVPARRRAVWPVAAALVFVAAALGAAAATYLRAPSRPPETRLDITSANITYFSGGSFALSPDGRALVVAGSAKDGVPQLWLRRFGTTESTPLAGTERGTLPFWSPDGRSVAFFSDAALKRIDLIDQSTQTLATLNYGTGGAWAPDGAILFSPTFSGRLMLVQHGRTAPLSGQPDRLAQQAPEFLPDGNQFLVFVASPADARGVYIGARDGQAPRKLLDADSFARYFDDGWVFFIRRGTLFAQRFDTVRAVISGDPLVVAQGVGAFSAARSGVIAYRATATNELGRLQWLEHDGIVRGDAVPSSAATGTNPVIAAGGGITWDRSAEGNRDVWVFDGTRATRLTSDGGVDFLPHWTPDGKRVVFSSNRRGALDLYDVPVDDPSAVRLIVESSSDKLVTDVSPDGSVIAYLQISDGGGQDIWTVRTNDPKSAAPFAASRSDERGAQFSPDGRWIAYQSDESGKYEVYVRRFPEQSGSGRQLVSTAGGIWPRWSANGAELYYVDSAGAVMASLVRSNGEGLQFAAPAMLFNGRFSALDPRIHAQYDVDRGGRFLVVANERTADVPPINVILNWSPPTR